MVRSLLPGAVGKSSSYHELSVKHDEDSTLPGGKFHSCQVIRLQLKVDIVTLLKLRISR